MSALLAALTAHGPTVLLGVTLVLAVGAVAVCCQRDPAQRRRVGVLTAVGAALYLLVGVLPLPRWREHQPVAVPSFDAAQRTAQLHAAVLVLATPPELAATPQSAASSPPTAAPSAAPQPHGDAELPWAMLAAGLYVGGVLLALLRRVAGHLQLRRLLAQATPLPAELAHGLDAPRGVRLLVTQRAARPFCTGLLRPVVVVPRALLAAERRAQARAVLRHEFAHLRAKDPAVWSLLAWLAVPLWCHPLAWWLARDVRFCSELLADDAAAAPDGRAAYARALIDLAERSDREVAAAGAVAVFHRPSEFYRRMQMLMSRPGPLSTSTSRARRAAQSIAMSCLVGTAALAFGVPTAAQQPANALQQENAELRDTLAALRGELTQLREQLAKLRPTSPSATRDAAPAGGAGAPGGPAAEDLREYVLQPGDSLAHIAARELGSADRWPEIRDLNPDLDASHPRVGQKLRLPPRRDQNPLGATLYGRGLLPGGHEQSSPTPPPMDTATTSIAALADLTSRYLDLQAELETAKVTAKESKTMASTGQMPPRDAARAALAVATLEKKLVIAGRLVDGEIDATRVELEWIAKRRGDCSPSEALQLEVQAQRAKTRLEALQSLR